MCSIFIHDLISGIHYCLDFMFFLTAVLVIRVRPAQNIPFGDPEVFLSRLSGILRTLYCNISLQCSFLCGQKVTSSEICLFLTNNKGQKTAVDKRMVRELFQIYWRWINQVTFLTVTLCDNGLHKHWLCGWGSRWHARRPVPALTVWTAMWVIITLAEKQEWRSCAPVEVATV